LALPVIALDNYELYAVKEIIYLGSI